ncbi:MAG TPA: biotin carboxylase N-terminal domain-containing protein [Aeromicrobium sp.]|nr:biotin carboxylase N-terminal domain-containing protein [Aeromicrobium sp.]HKY59141.1 biotin carboxylase N-terminal domain-containing protein [Aeromicrobium sp.]
MTESRLTKVYVANRGEIAARVGRTCARLGIEVVAADVASFLDAGALIAQARAWGADAVHPGYGFLSENADFAQAVIDAGLTWIGPSPSAISAMARKDKAREIAEAAGVPVAPRYDVEDVPGDAYPVLVKAAAGGGGKGMHVVRHPDELADAVATAGREAKAAFGDDTLLIERYIEGGRHVEVQVFGDEHGAVVHLGTRDCSAQRRHQKIVEEAPAPALSSDLRARLHDAAVALARAVDYANAGTVEFLVLGDDAFLLEMNTRLQVEHPVTEEITGLDLVEWQLRVAAGESLPLAQSDITFTGHAIEARVYAEDAYHGFLPQAGQALAVEWPTGDVRIEEDFGGTVTTQFDPMIAKLVVHRSSRPEALAAMLGALEATAFYGLTTNVGYLHRVVEAMALPGALIHTNWLEGEGAHLLEPPAEPVVPEVDGTPFGVADGWRLGGDPAVVEHAPTRRVGGRLFARRAGHTWEVLEPDPFDRTHGSGPAGDDVVAPMPGAVVAIDVAEGDPVVAGQRLGALEAMKMELALTAPHDGTVTHVGAAKGDQVTQGHVLVTVTPAEDRPVP